jgi:ABC-type transport system involved in cytochrome c biogenesis permease subunit
MMALYKIFPWFFLTVFSVEVAVVMFPRKDGAIHSREFGRLPVLLNGRIQPLDSVARNALLQIRSTGDVPLELTPSWKFWYHPKKLRSTDWLLEVFFKPAVSDTRPIFLIHHPDLINGFKLSETGIEKSGLRYYTYEELQPILGEISLQSRQAADVQDAQRTTYQKQVLKLANALMLYQRLKNSVQPDGSENLVELVAQYEASLPAGLAAVRAQQAGEKADEIALKRMTALVEQFNAMANLAYPLIVPPLAPEKDRNAWSNIGTSLLRSIQTGALHPAVNFFARMSVSYGRDNAAEFNAAVDGYRAWLSPKFDREVSKGRAEFYFNNIKAFLHASIIYLFAFLLAAGALLTFGTTAGLSESLRRSAFYLITLAFVVHTFGLVYRMVLEGRPPVTNLYSSAIFIGWGACALGMTLERVYKIGLGSAVAALAGFVTLLIAHNLALGGDTMEMMRAVLDTNFWLATHVVVVTLGYASTFVAGTLGTAYIILGIFTRLLAAKVGKAETSGNLGKALAKMVYAIVCFASLFSFTGTVLGGIWADQSWGRFWGWDPKENGALLIVIWNVLILHARWGGLVGDRGVMNLAAFGNIITAFSWFGVNMLGIGLHSYGFMDAAFKWLMLFDAAQLLLILLGSLPLRFWKSFQGNTSPARKPTNSSVPRKISPASAGL